MRVHRFVWELINGPIPRGLGVLHTCDTPACYEPTHLFLGTQADNMADKCHKGRQRHGGAAGDDHGCAKLTSLEVVEIRSRTGTSQRALAKEYGVGKTTIARIHRRQGWKHL